MGCPEQSGRDGNHACQVHRGCSSRSVHSEIRIRGRSSRSEFALRVRSEGPGGRFDLSLLRELVSYTASAINLRVDAPGRKDGAEQLEAADVHALMSHISIGKPNAKAR